MDGHTNHFKLMKVKSLFGIAALALLFASCSTWSPTDNRHGISKGDVYKVQKGVKISKSRKNNYQKGLG